MGLGSLSTVMTRLIEFFKQPGKIPAFLIHFAISGLLVVTLAAAVYLIWYPSPYLEHDGARDILRIVILVDVVLGPLLTLVLFRRGKKGAARDVGIVATLQLVAFVYGAGLIMIYRPAFLVYADDSFYVVRWPEVAEQSKDHERLDQMRVRKGPTMVVAELPQDPAERKRIRGDAAVPYQGDLYQPMTPERWRSIVAKAIKLEEQAGTRPALAEGLARFQVQFLDRSGKTLDRLAFFEVFLRSGTMFFAWERDSGELFGWVN
jgi:hypothetical protein